MKRSFDSIKLSLIEEIADAETKDNKRYLLYVDRSRLRGRLNNIGCAVLADV